MNRLLLTAATALGMAVSSHAMAVTYTLDSFEGANSLLGGGNDPFSNYVQLDAVGSSTAGGIANYTSDGFTFSRSVLFEQTEAADFDSTSMLFISGADQEAEPTHYAAAVIQNYNSVNSKLTLTYDISSLDAAVGTDKAAFKVNIISTDAGVGQEVYIDAVLNGTTFETWTLNSPVVFFEQPATSHTFNVLGSSLTGADQLSFVVRGSAGYNAILSPLTFDVLPVPELGLLPMFGSGLLVVGFAARRKRRAVQSA